MRLTWLSIFRTVATSLLLGVFALRLLTGPTRDLSREESLSFAIIGAVYSLTLIYGVWLRRGPVGTLAAVVQVSGDVLIATSLVFITGGPESPFTFTYSLAVVTASILLSQRGALVTAAVCSISYGVLLGSFLARAPGAVPAAALERSGYLLISNLLAHFLIAALTGYLSRQLSATGGRLSASQADLRQLATLHKQILDSSPSGILTCEPDGRITFINPAGQSILGVDAQAIGAARVDALLPGVDTQGKVSRYEVQVETPRGPRTLGLSVGPLEGRAGAARLIIFQDLTALRRTEDELRRADRLAALGTLAAQLAHEIRNPLASMRGSAQMLAQDAKGDAGSERLTAILLRESDRLSRLVEDFLRFARPPPPQRQPVALDALVSEVVELLRADPLGRSVQVVLELTPVRAQVDPDQIRQVLVNLLRNAFQAAGPGGRVRVSLTVEADGTPQLRVWDSAGAIPEAHLGRIFEPFFTTRSGGTGLGLSSAHSIVRAHGGRIHVTSAPQSGTEFMVALPLAGEETQGARPGGG
ncbi:ATP-binding protein [Myxococcaceae bacterium GXIMD 01537]